MITNLQVPIEKSIRDNSMRVAREYGYSSLQDAVRMFLTQLANKKIAITIGPASQDEVLTKAQEAVLMKKYKKTKDEIAHGNGFVARDADELINHLNEAE